jgi:hypothetical protein
MASSISTGVLSASTLISTGRNRINAITVLTDGTNTATLSLYDNTSAAGTVSVKGACVGANLVNHIIFENPVVMENGIYASVTGTGATFIVFYGG